MSLKNDLYINKRLYKHLHFATETYHNQDWFVICLQGSQNYGIADEASDVDTKLLLIPSLEEVVLNKKAISHTLEMLDNKEHIDCKDVREYFKIFRKSNINFIEILFTNYYIVNNKYIKYWKILKKNAESLARMNPYAAVKCIKGMAFEKRHALCHEYPSRMPWIEKFGYDPKQLSHLIRISYFLEWYIEGKSYKDCIYPKDPFIRKSLLAYKRDGQGLSKEEAEAKADEILDKICIRAESFCQTHSNENDLTMDLLLDKVLYELMVESLLDQLIEKKFDEVKDPRLENLQLKKENKKLKNIISWDEYPESMGR